MSNKVRVEVDEMKYEKPEMSIIDLVAEDIITESQLGSGGTGGDVIKPFNPTSLEL